MKFYGYVTPLKRKNKLLCPAMSGLFQKRPVVADLLLTDKILNKNLEIFIPWLTKFQDFFLTVDKLLMTNIWVQQHNRAWQRWEIWMLG
jgi:hypothetical protein